MSVKIKIWEDGCGANVGSVEVHFTGILKIVDGREFQRVYIILKDKGKLCPMSGLYSLSSRSFYSLRQAVKQARQDLKKFKDTVKMIKGKRK